MSTVVYINVLRVLTLNVGQIAISVHLRAHRIDIKPYNTEMFLYKPWIQKFLFQFEITINGFNSQLFPLHLNTPMLWVYNHYNLFNSFSAGTVFIRQNLTSTDRNYASESDVFRRQILTYKEAPHAGRVNPKNVL